MPRDAASIEDTRAWLKRAATDLRAADCDLAASPPLFEDALFHCQQAAEKSMKAYLAWADRPFRKTHNLEELGRQCVLIDSSLEEIVDRAVPLTEYAWKFRYPGELGEPTPEEAESSLELARELYKAMLDRLPEEVRE